MVEPGRLHWEPDLIPSWWPQDLGQIHMNNDDLTVPLSAEMGLDSLRESAWATTGTMAAWWARTTFPDAQMDIAGYSFVDEPTQTAWAHAYGEDCDIERRPPHRAGGRTDAALDQRGQGDALELSRPGEP